MSDPLAINYYLNQYCGPAVNNLIAYIDCNNTVTGSLTQLATGSGYFAVSLSGSGSYNPWVNSSCAYLSGSYIKLKQNTTGNISINDSSTILMVYENLSTGGGVLASTVKNYNNYSGGFEFGVNADNNLYFQYYNNAGPQTLIFNESLADKCSVFLNLSQNKVNFGYYDFFKNYRVSNDFSINSQYLFPSNITGNDIYIGYNPISSGGYSYNKNFIGNIYDVMVFSPSIYPYEIDIINSGLVSNYTSGQTVITSTGVLQVTGYATGVVSYYTEITGHSISFTGMVSDALGNQYSGYQVNDLTGTRIGTGAIPLSGFVNIYTTGYTDPTLQLNTGYLLTFGKSKINVMDYYVSGDMLDISLETGIFYVTGLSGIVSKYLNSFYQKNLQATYLYSSSAFINSFISQNSGDVSAIVYLNGLAQSVSNIVYTGSVYNSQPYPDIDYYLTGNQIGTSQLFSENNSNVIIDASPLNILKNLPYVITGFNVTGYGVSSDGIRYILNVPFVSSGNLISTNYQNLDIFYNGQKLIQGKDSEIGDSAHYGITGYQSGGQFTQGLYFKNILPFSGTSGVLLVTPNIGDVNLTGNNFLLNFSGSKYLPNYTKVYLNGVRLYNGIDYLECGNYDLRAAGSGYFNNKSSIVYNGDASDFTIN